MPRKPYTNNETLFLHYGPTLVGRTPTTKEVDALNQGVIPWYSVEKVTRPRGKVHYFPECGGKEHKGLSRSTQDTTCLHCLLRRASELKGYRWTCEHNTDEVAYLTEMLGDKVKGFAAEQPGDRELRERIEVSGILALGGPGNA